MKIPNCMCPNTQHLIQSYRWYSYETEDSFQSKFIEEISKMSTTSAKR